MFKKVLMATALLGMVASASVVQAQSCPNSWFSQQKVEYAFDIAKNNRRPLVSCCPEGYRVHGVACSDLPPDQDLADGCSAVCRSIAKGDFMQPSVDFQRQPIVSRCDKTEVFVGIACKDITQKGGDEDYADSCVAVCQHPKTGRVRRVMTVDLQNNNRPWNEVIIPLSDRRVSGILCKDMQKGSSDRNDGCTIITGVQRMK